jgi:acyl-CoA reductase-like NAD-dependent aldehyde dehydrogenase
MLATISGQLSQFQNLTDSQLRESISLLTNQTQSRLDQLQDTTEKQLSETLKVVATDTRTQIYQALNRASEAAEEALANMQSEASKAYDEPLRELLDQVQAISEAMAKLSDEARQALLSEVKGLRAQNKRLTELMLHFGKLSEQLETSVQAVGKENQKAKIQNDRAGRQWWQAVALAAVVSMFGSTLISLAFWLIATR